MTNARPDHRQVKGADPDRAERDGNAVERVGTDPHDGASEEVVGEFDEDDEAAHRRDEGRHFVISPTQNVADQQEVGKDVEQSSEDSDDGQRGEQ